MGQPSLANRRGWYEDEDGAELISSEESGARWDYNTVTPFVVNEQGGEAQRISDPDNGE